MVNLTEFLSSHSICLNSYEERIGVTTRGETICAERINAFKEIVRTNAKRPRYDSNSEKKSPDIKRSRFECDSEKSEHPLNAKSKNGHRDYGILKPIDDLPTSYEQKYDGDFMVGSSSSDDLDGIAHMPDSTLADEYDGDDCIIKTEIKSELSDEADSVQMKKEIDVIDTGQEPTMIVPDCIKQSLIKRNRNAKHTISANRKRDIRKETFRPLINEEVIKEIRKGWTADTVGDLTVGDVYIMFGQDSKVFLEYRWDEKNFKTDINTELINNIELMSPMKPLSNDDNAMINTNSMLIPTEYSKQQNPITNKLKQLLMLATMTEKTKRKASCACGHYCDRGINKSKVSTQCIDSILYSSSITFFECQTNLSMAILPYSSYTERRCVATQLYFQQNLSNFSYGQWFVPAARYSQSFGSRTNGVIQAAYECKLRLYIISIITTSNSQNTLLNSSYIIVCAECDRNIAHISILTNEFLS